MASRVLPAILTLLCFGLIVQCQQNSQPAKDQGCPHAWRISPPTPKLTEKSDAWVSENSGEDGVTSLQYCWVFQSGVTTIRRLEPNKLKEIPAGLEVHQRYAQLAGEKIRVGDLPIGFSIYRNLAFEVKTAALLDGSSITLRLPSIKTEEEFDRLVLLYLDEDPLVPGALQWQDCLTEEVHQKSDFVSRTLTADFDFTSVFHHATGMGRLVIASFNKDDYDKSAVDLFITSVVGPPYVKLGETFVYSISIRNSGGTGRPATDVVVHSSINGARFVSGTATQGTCRQSVNSTPDIVCELGKLDFGKTVTMTLTVKSDDLGVSLGDEKEFVFLTLNTVRSREKDYSPENNYYESRGTIVRRN